MQNNFSKTKPILLLCILCALTLVLGACQSKTPLEKATGLSAEECKAITITLAENDITFDGAEKADLTGLSSAEIPLEASYTGVQLTGKAGTSMTLVLDGASIVAVLDSRTNVVLYAPVRGNG